MTAPLKPLSERIASVPPEVRRALRIEGATSTYPGPQMYSRKQLARIAALFVDARWPEDAPAAAQANVIAPAAPGSKPTKTTTDAEG